MNLSPFGKAVRKLRIDAEVYLIQMAEYLGVRPATLSAMETGRAAVPLSITTRSNDFFKSLGVLTPDLNQYADGPCRKCPTGAACTDLGWCEACCQPPPSQGRCAVHDGRSG